MVSMTIDFNGEKLIKAGKTANQLLEVYDDYCEKHYISKPKINVFEMDGANDLALIGKIMCDIAKSRVILELIDTWYWIVDGEREDLLQGAFRWENKR